LNMDMPEDEAAHITMHLINAQLDGNMSHTDEITSLLTNCLRIIEIKSGILINEDSWAYDRFLRHLLALAQRIIANKENTGSNAMLNETIRQQFEKDYQIALGI